MDTHGDRSRGQMIGSKEKLLLSKKTPAGMTQGPSSYSGGDGGKRRGEIGTLLQRGIKRSWGKHRGLVSSCLKAGGWGLDAECTVTQGSHAVDDQNRNMRQERGGSLSARLGQAKSKKREKGIRFRNIGLRKESPSNGSVVS